MEFGCLTGFIAYRDKRSCRCHFHCATSHAKLESESPRGWIMKSQVASLRDFLQEGFGSRVLLETRDVTEKDWDDVPIQLRNNALVEPFELVTEMYALPRYYEKDPTPIVSLFYFVFFGMMVADIGYGLLLTVATGFALKAFKLKPGTAKNLRFFSLLEFPLPFGVWSMALSLDLRCLLPDQYDQQRHDHPDPLSGLWFYHRLSGPLPRRNEKCSPQRLHRSL